MKLMDMVEAIQTHHDTRSTRAIMIDHTPGIQHPNGSWASRTYGNDYHRALIQAVYR